MTDVEVEQVMDISMILFRFLQKKVIFQTLETADFF